MKTLTRKSSIKPKNWLQKGLFKPVHPGNGVIPFCFSLFLDSSRKSLLPRMSNYSYTI